MEVDDETTFAPVRTLKRIDKLNKDVIKKQKQKEQKRLFIGNLSFKVEESELREIFSKFGPLKKVTMPLRQDGRKKGFAFVEFEDSKSVIKAMTSINKKKLHGRQVTVDFAVDNQALQEKVSTSKQENKKVTKKNSRLKVEAKTKQDSGEDESGGEEESNEEEESDEEEDSNVVNESEEEEESDEEEDLDFLPLKAKENQSKKVQDILAHETFSGDKVDKHVTKKVKKPKLKKRKRLIVRNLSFKIEEDELKEIFSKFGTVKETTIPLNNGKKRGFGFVEFEDTKSLINAMKSMNWKEIHGRKVAVDFAVDKSSYELKLQALRQEGTNAPKTDSGIKLEAEIKKELVSSEEESEEEDEDEKRLNDFLRDFDSGAEKLTKSQTQDEQNVSSGESSSEESEEDDSDEEDDSPVSKKKIKLESDDTSSSPIKISQKKESHDVSEGKTVFLRNVSFATTQESLSEIMVEYGECEYCLLCMDQFTDRPKGTAFVKFKEKESADKLVKESLVDPGVLVDGRKLTCSYAMSREDVSHIGEDSKKPKDRRNLNLLRVGLIMPNSEESEGVSPSDMIKRSQLEIVKKQKLKNVNFFVSDKRLLIHNLPKQFNDGDLRQLLIKAAGRGSIITEARVMRDLKKIDANGKAISKGYGFASFSEHKDALKALNELNNNPSIFTSQKRPIVEFSIENKVALLSKERKKEKALLLQERNKKNAQTQNKRPVVELSGKSKVSLLSHEERKGKTQMRNKNLTKKKNELKLKSGVANVETGSTEFLTKNKKKSNKNKKNKPVEKMTHKSEEPMEMVSEETSANSQNKKNKKRRNKNKNKPAENMTHMSEGPMEIAAEETSANLQNKKKKKKSGHSKKDMKLSNGKSQQNMTTLVKKFKDKLKNKLA